MKRILILAFAVAALAGSPAAIRSRTNSRRSRARGASESSIDWFWHTMQRNSCDNARALASLTGSAMISSGCTAEADDPASTAMANAKARIFFN